MKMKKPSSLVSIVMALAIAIYPFAWSGIASAAGKSAMELKPGLLKGTITDTTNRAVTELPIKLLDKNGSTVSKVVTDESGKFSMSDLDEGGYTLAVGEHYNLKLALKKEAEASEMKVVIPEGDAIAPAAGFTVTHLLVGGIIVAIVGGVAIAVSSDSSSSHRVSP